MPIDTAPAVKLLVDTFSEHNIPYQFIGSMADLVHSISDEIPDTTQVEIQQSQMDFAAYLLKQYKTGSMQFAESASYRAVLFTLLIEGVQVSINQQENSQILTSTGWCNLNLDMGGDLNKSEVKVWQNIKLKVQPLALRQQLRELLKT
jgi:hypothetical protein